jgi:carbonic anhydrase
MYKSYGNLGYNQAFVKEQAYTTYQKTKEPDKKIVILSCMDTRLTELLPKALNLKNGDAKIIKNAGASIMHPFGSTTRSIIVAIYEFDVDEVYVIGHHGCGMSHLNAEKTIEKVLNKGIKKEVLSTLTHAGVHVNEWLKGFDSIEDSIKRSVEAIKQHPLVPPTIIVHGLIIDPKTGQLDVVVNGY